jgi:hypothetical protein
MSRKSDAERSNPAKGKSPVAQGGVPGNFVKSGFSTGPGRAFSPMALYPQKSAQKVDIPTPICYFRALDAKGMAFVGPSLSSEFPI